MDGATLIAPGNGARRRKTMLIVVGLALVVVLALVAIVATRRPRSKVGRLDRRARRSDRSQPEPAPTANVLEEPTTDVTKHAANADAALAVTAPIDEWIGVTRRQFFNRSVLTGLGLGVAAFGASSLAFLWPTAGSGFGGKITVGSISDVESALAMNSPYYNATAKTYIVAYPKADLPGARRVPAYTAPIIAGMEAGYVALYQRCVHLGCRVPFCSTSQWFECPCHGSKYNGVGEKTGGPAPRGLDRFVFEVSGDRVVVDTGSLVLGPPIGTDTTHQTPAGALCV
jgi:cytochrome b6-f complex iron-sulfur subunit